MNVVAIVQARMSSTRLPGKVLLPLAGKPVLAHVVDRLRSCNSINNVVLATSADPSDDAVAEWCGGYDVECFRGSLDDVLDRFYQAAKEYSVDSVVRITADCPAIDPEIIDEVVEQYVAGGFDYYGLSGEFPDGLDCTVISFNALEAAWKDAKLLSEREHVGPYIEKNPERFVNGGYEKFTGLGHHRWTLDETRDYEFLGEVFGKLYKANDKFGYAEILELMDAEPELMNINSGIVRNEGYAKSLENDRK